MGGEREERERRESGQSSINRGEKSTKNKKATQRYKGDEEVENIRGKSLV